MYSWFTLFSWSKRSHYDISQNAKTEPVYDEAEVAYEPARIPTELLVHGNSKVVPPQ